MSLLHEPRFRIIKELLADCFFKTAVDLGCGDGALGSKIRDNIGYLIGVDHNNFALKRAKRRGIYDDLVLCDVRDYEVPLETEAIFICEALEHLPKEDGLSLLKRVGQVPFVIVTTPEKFTPISFQDGHVCLWTAAELEDLGFEALFYRRGILVEALYGYGLIGVKYPKYWRDFNITERIKRGIIGYR